MHTSSNYTVLYTAVLTCITYNLLVVYYIYYYGCCLGFEGPIRSRLVENGYLGEVEPAKGMRQGTGTKAWPQPDEAEANAHSGLATSANRPTVGGTSQRFFQFGQYTSAMGLDCARDSCACILTHPSCGVP